MFAKTLAMGELIVSAGVVAAAGPSPAASDGTVRLRSAYSMGETIDRLKQDIASKGITFFAAIEQSKLAGAVGVELRPSTLLIFGNPALGAQFITSNPIAGRDWPVRLPRLSG